MVYVCMYVYIYVCICSPTSNKPALGGILSRGLTNIGIGQEVLITTSSARRSANCLASKVYTTIISTLVHSV